MAKETESMVPFPGISIMEAWDHPLEGLPSFQLSSHDKWLIEQQTREDLTPEEAEDILFAELM